MNNIKEHITDNTYERIIFINRLSAIGDVIISSHTVVKLIINGYFPVFITSHSTKDIALRINGLQAFICHQKGKKFQRKSFRQISSLSLIQCWGVMGMDKVF